ncbi:5-oxoprolinase [Spea bombifrons]|uniref:5-oxoprolinase n=1 Tax=Spea bombifrons TaxID=233779 RepID=UPI00234B8EBB|nr:5-oxoprolinase [Spea bombifrons]XP_053322647.1 5-oxoprolinase [Spea bombifrons]XP_053322648.1 5-oxoprolinase [Spea bombifrons]
MDGPDKFQFAIDRGGTFTDVFARCPGGKVRVMKLLSEDPANYQDAPTEGIRRILEEETAIKFPRDQPLDTDRIEWIRMGTTVATNALLERKGERIALLITRGFRDLLHIGNQARPKIFDLEIQMPEVLYEEVIEVEERVVLKRDGCGLPKDPSIKTFVGSSGDSLEVWEPLNLEHLKHELLGVLSRGIRSLAVVLMHSYTWSSHERQIGELARSLGFSHVSLSSEVMPMIRMVPRGYTACADAYLTPCIQRYLDGFCSGFRNQLKDLQVLFMRSDGGLTPMHSFSGSRAILSGPAGGVVGYAITTYNHKQPQPVIGFDMGGTSTDVSRYAGEYEHVFEATTAGISIQAPQLDVNTVAAGGGSMLFFRSGLFVVGPESAGAHPGPACYRKGGPLTVTDANLCLGRLLPDYFPKIFGPSEDQPLARDDTLRLFQELTAEINRFQSGRPGVGAPLSVEEVAMGFIRVANEAMCRPIRSLTQAKGHDTSRHVLACFGGAGGQHACAIARSLGMKTVFIHKYGGVLSAFGMALANVVHEAQEPCSVAYDADSFPLLEERIAALERQCIEALQRQGFHRSQIDTEPFLHLRYERTDCALMCSAKGYPASVGSCRVGDFQAAFNSRYLTEFGFTIPSRVIVVDDIRVRGTGSTGIRCESRIQPGGQPPRLEAVTKCFFEEGYMDSNVYLLQDLTCDHAIPGPAIIIDRNSTILVEPDCRASVTEYGDIQISVGSGRPREIGLELDTIQLSIFSHRFMSIAEQMGRILQRTAISTNIKERLDFSCALFGPDGGLVSNAPHIPVHLGAMQETVQFQIKNLQDDLKEGDVILSNHPCAGGSHLPDLTVITPVFRPEAPRPVFFVASRGHHADIGGVTPGSMPPHSKSLQEEGAVFTSFKLVQGGEFQEEAVTEALMAPGLIPGSSGTRNLHDNLSDLRAQVAANQKGIQLVNELIDAYRLEVVQAYMAHIQANAEVAVREMLREFAERWQRQTGALEVESVDHMDDGSPIRLRVQINKEEGSAMFDFSGSGYEVFGNCNAPRAITLSALIYCLRSMVGRDIPLNQGCLAPINVIIPKGSILDPSPDAAVVGGNVLTSQRIVDVIFKAFGVCAASQGCMNNITFGNQKTGYYETVAGGAGAGPRWDGRSGIHTHMTNTRITDPEILEKRYPVVLKRFELSPGTGGAGQFCGGDGVIRELLFREEVILSVLTERRAFRPYGLQGGSPGAPGLNLLHRRDGRTINLGGKTSVPIQPGDVFVLRTPGGGGYGKCEEREKAQTPSKKHSRSFAERGSVFDYRMAQETV